MSHTNVANRIVEMNNENAQNAVNTLLGNKKMIIIISAVYYTQDTFSVLISVSRLSKTYHETDYFNFNLF